MGLLAWLKGLKKQKPEDKNVEKYNKGMEKSRSNFSNKLTNLSKRYKSVNRN